MFENASHLNLISLFGLFAMVALAFLMSSNRGRINWRLVGMGMLLQVVLGVILFNSQTWTFNGKFEGGVLFWAMDSFFGSIMNWTNEGSQFVFGNGRNEPHEVDGQMVQPSTNPMFILTTFAFGVMPTVVFFAALMSVLYHIGIMEPIVKGMAWVMQKVLGTSGSESLAAAANVFVGHTEAPLVVRPFIANMTRSELNAMMVGGFATITGGLMAVFVGAFGISAGHLVAASIISAPAALVIAKVLQPETGKSETLGLVTAKFEKSASNVIEAAANGASDGVKLALNIVGMLIAFLALIAMFDSFIMALGEGVEYFVNKMSGKDPVDIQWTLKGLFGLLFWPLAWLMGIETAQCRISGELLGTKMVVNEFLAYNDLGVALKDLENGVENAPAISERTEVILTYALCGFSNFGAIGIQLGGIGPLAPNRKSDLAQLGFRAMLGGMLACCMTACIAGIMYGVLK